jgi:hypothetical protein
MNREVRLMKFFSISARQRRIGSHYKTRGRSRILVRVPGSGVRYRFSGRRAIARAVPRPREVRWNPQGRCIPCTANSHRPGVRIVRRGIPFEIPGHMANVFACISAPNALWFLNWTTKFYPLYPDFISPPSLTDFWLSCFMRNIPYLATQIRISNAATTARSSLF